MPSPSIRRRVEAGQEATLWLRPSEGFALVGIGRAWSIEPAGPERFGEADAAWRSLVEGARLPRPAEVRGLGPVLLGGMGFTGRAPESHGAWAPFGASSMVVPSLAALQSDGNSWLTASIVADGSAADAKAAGLERTWTQIAARAGELRRTQPSPPRPRPTPPSRSKGSGRPFSSGATSSASPRVRWVAAGSTRSSSPAASTCPRPPRSTCRVPFAASPPARPRAPSSPSGAGTAQFIGATPERLVRAEGRTYRTAAVAGSIRRGADPAEDAALAAELLASEKEREEHAVVVRAIRRQLAPISDRLEIAPEPGVLVLRHVQHLVTEVAGTLRVQEGLLALAGRLHPTPAVGGEPRDLALAMIDEHEGFDRGWYAGPVGWLSADGDGELMVALRCGLVEDRRVTLYAGCGIVADSDPDREWEESRIKMRAVAAALGRAGDEP